MADSRKSRMKVLVADDDRIGLELLSLQLTNLGYDVVTSPDGRDAWQKFQDDSFAMVISDWLMPEMDGLELLRNIRAAETTQYVYCILLTVKGQLADLIQGMDAGADDFLTKPFDPGELRVRLAAGQRVIDLEHQLRATNSRMKSDLETAAKIQRSLLPTNLPDSYSHRFAWQYRPCDELGGDILNVIPLGPDQVALYLLDVAGHGAPAALLAVALSRMLTTATATSSIVRDFVPHENDYRVVAPSEVLRRLNESACNDDGPFFTMMYGVFNLRTRLFRYASAGHTPALLLGLDGSAKKLASTGYPVGIVEDATYEQVEIELNPRDRLLIYSDGIVEAENGKSDPFGVDRLVDFARHRSHDTIQTVLNDLVEHLVEWSHPAGFRDDVSCLFAEAGE